MKSLCVYCSSSDRLAPPYLAVATDLGRELAQRGWSLVYGGGRTGMMGALAQAAKGHGAHVTGIIPEFMKVHELEFTGADETITVATMRERKQRMEERADAFVALPGGFGTLEELMEIVTLRQLDLLRKPCVLLNQDGFFEDLLRHFSRMNREGFIKPANLDLIRVATTVPDLFSKLALPEGAANGAKWYETRKE